MTRIRQAIRYMKELESGFDRTLLPLPTETVFLKPAGPLSGRYVPFEADPHDEEDYSGLVSIPWLWHQAGGTRHAPKGTPAARSRTPRRARQSRTAARMR